MSVGLIGRPASEQPVCALPAVLQNGIILAQKTGSDTLTAVAISTILLVLRVQLISILDLPLILSAEARSSRSAAVGRATEETLSFGILSGGAKKEGDTCAVLIRESHMVEHIEERGAGFWREGERYRTLSGNSPIVEICLQLFGGIVLTTGTLFLLFKVLLTRGPCASDREQSSEGASSVPRSGFMEGGYSTRDMENAPLQTGGGGVLRDWL
ncbi:hypothetical protein CgunFtcFv8_020102 [Champsocephalus gunnari]|uniref:Uncharacterized protein n=1 Tax=Champsocephalus gunnari TaxID=52237 RepID=A0AAN8DIM7_CHAGU|nr:hypothetical protein CgunFtcFv8_020102 [Champsocephalus gunnari]